MQATTTTLARAPASTWNSEPTTTSASRDIGAPDLRLSAPASTLPLPKCTGDGDRRFSALPAGRELHRPAIRSIERPASVYSVRL